MNNVKCVLADGLGLLEGDPALGEGGPPRIGQRDLTGLLVVTDDQADVRLRLICMEFPRRLARFGKFLFPSGGVRLSGSGRLARVCSGVWRPGFFLI